MTGKELIDGVWHQADPFLVSQLTFPNEMHDRHVSIEFLKVPLPLFSAMDTGFGLCET